MSIKAETSFSLKDQLFNPATVGTLAQALSTASPKFDSKAFNAYCRQRFPSLELKARIECMVDGLHRLLPDDFDQARLILLDALPQPLDPSLSDDDFGDFIWVVPGEYIARYGCSEDQLQASLEFLRSSTQRFSAEYAIRHFLLRFPQQTLAFLNECAGHENYHVRRLASEGSRPALPWGLKVTLPTRDLLSLLTKLHTDPTRYVTRSVANALNDISKRDADAVLDSLSQWQLEARQQPSELDWLSRHALRSLLKQGNPRAMTFLGYPAKPKVDVSNVVLPASVAVGGALSWQGTLLAKASQKQQLRLALRVEFLKANGRHSEKVFALKDLQAGPGESYCVRKKIAFKPMTTRVLYPGTHYVSLLVNGKAYQRREFNLVV